MSTVGGTVSAKVLTGFSDEHLYVVDFISPWRIPENELMSLGDTFPSVKISLAFYVMEDHVYGRFSYQKNKTYLLEKRSMVKNDLFTSRSKKTIRASGEFNRFLKKYHWSYEATVV